MAATVMSILCRDCGDQTDATSADGRSASAVSCPVCGSSRRITHPELGALTIAHLDCDAFYAAIEKRDDPSLKEKPVLVGGGQRGVVSTCCYIARLYGVHSAMPMFKALKACPDAVVIKPDHQKYSAEGKRVREKMRALTPLVEPVSIDEAYMDLSGTTQINKGTPAQSLARLALEIERDIGITVSIGLSANKFLAKTASELDKPRGFAVIGTGDAMDVLAERDVGDIHGVGPKFAAKLARDGLKTVADIQRSDMKALIGRYGETGLWLHNRARGIDNRPVSPHSERKSVSSEITFDKDISDPEALMDRLWTVCVRTADRAKAAEVEGVSLSLKLKTRDFRTLTRSRTLSQPTQLAQTLFRVMRPALEKETGRGQSYRLIGVGIAGLQPAGEDMPDLIDPTVEKRAAMERAADLARSKFGSDAVVTGRAAKAAAARDADRKDK